jgi:hypothetical protein
MDDSDEPYEVDDILKNFSERKKRKDSKDKGGRGERLLIAELDKRFPGMAFSRTVGSGNRWSQARLTETAKQVFTGDIVTPENFLFVLECKYGYNDISLDRAVQRAIEGKSGNAQLNKFLKQAEKDGNSVNKKPLLCWKQNYKPWLAFLKTEHLTDRLANLVDKAYHNWTIFSLDQVFHEPDTFFLR